MNLNKILILGIFIILMTNCKEEKKGFILKGKINGNYSEYIYLNYKNQIDSTLVTNNLFEFKGNVSQPTLAILSPANPKQSNKMTVVSFMLENSLIETSLTYSEKTSSRFKKQLDLDTIFGSKSQKIRKDFENKLIKNVYSEKNDSVKKSKLFTNLKQFISENPQSEMSGEYLANLGRQFNYLSANQFESLINIMDTTYQNKKDLNRILKLIKQKQLFALGQKPPELILPNINDELINNRSFNGKLVLLEFWASWCYPCRNTNPDLVKIYDKYKSKDFEILGISIDKNKSDWKKAIEKDKLTWPQVIDSMRTTEKTYYLNSIPFNLLLNKKGNIIAKNIKPLQLEEILKNEI